MPFLLSNHKFYVIMGRFIQQLYANSQNLIPNDL